MNTLYVDDLHLMVSTKKMCILKYFYLNLSLTRRSLSSIVTAKILKYKKKLQTKVQNIFLMLLARCNPYPWGWSRLLYTPGAPTFTLVAPDALPYLSPGTKEVCTFPVSFLYLGAQTFSLCRLQGEIFENTICTHQLRYS